MDGLPAAEAHPLAGSLAWAAGPLPYWPVRFGAPGGPGWRAYPTMLSVDAVTGLLAEVDGALRGGSALAAQTLAGQVAGPVLGVLSAVLFAERRLAVLEPGQIMFHFASGGGPAEFPDVAVVGAGVLVLPGDPAAGRPEVTVVPTVEDLQRALLDQAHRLFEPFVDMVSSVGRRGRRALWQGLADRIAVGFLQAGKHVGAVDRARAEAEATLGCMPDRPLRLTIDWLEVEHAGDTEWFKRKSVCCLHYKSAVHRDRYCATCPLLPREESLHRLGALLDGGPA